MRDGDREQLVEALELCEADRGMEVAERVVEADLVVKVFPCPARAPAG